jgi:hypothetical protein
MSTATALYRKLGFEPMQAYYHNPLAGVLFMRRMLTPSPLPPPMQPDTSMERQPDQKESLPDVFKIWEKY